MTAPTFYNYITTFSSETSPRSGMLCEELSRIFTIKSITLLNNVKIHEYVIHRLKIPRPPAVPVQARLRVPEKKSRRRPVCGGFSFFSSPPSTGGTSPQPGGEAGQARPSLPGDRPGRSGARHQYEMASKTPSTRQVPPCRCKMPERLSCISSTASSRRASVEQRDAKSSVSEPARL